VADIYADQALTSHLPAAFAADVNGNYNFFVPTGSYLIQESNAIGAGYTFNYSYMVFANGSGTVTSVDLSMPSIFTVSGNPVTTSGTLTVDLNTEAADTVFGNCTGSTAVPSFCSLVANQIPTTLNATRINGLTVSGNESVTGMLGVTGATTLSSTLNVTGLSTLTAVNATAGYQIGGAAPSNHILVGNGTNYVDSATLPSSALPTANIYYQTVALIGSSQTQRPTLNFNSTLFTAADSASPARTNIGLNSPGTGIYVATYASNPGASMAVAAFDGNGNLVPTSFSTPASFNAPQRVTLGAPVLLVSGSQTIILTESVAFPAATGTYRADVRYGAWITAASNACAAEAIDTTNGVPLALSAQDTNGSGYIALSGSEVTVNTYAASSHATFTLQVQCNAGQTVTVNSALFTFSPAEPTYLSVTPVLTN
jgi:hypothetical protein